MWILCLEELLAFAENWNLKFTCQSSAISSDSKWISLDRALSNQVYLKLLIAGGWSRWPLKTPSKAQYDCMVASQVHTWSRHNRCQRPSKVRWALDLQLNFLTACSANLCDQTHAAAHRLDTASLNVHQTVYCREKAPAECRSLEKQASYIHLRT